MFSSIVDRYIPKKNVMICPGDKPWMNGAIRRAIRKRNRLLKSYTKFKSSSKWEKYRINRNLVIKIRKAKLDYQQKTNEMLSNLATSAKKWWNVAKSFYGSKVSSAIPPLYENNNYVFDPKDKADLFNDFFVSQTYLPIGNAVLPELSPNLNPTLSNIIVTEVEVANLISQLDTAKACGMDGISNIIIKLCNYGIYKPFTKLINISLSLGQFPQSWKLENVLPLFKKDNKQIKSNYRPVALVSCLSKICEKVVYMKVYTFLVSIGFFYRFQSGFRSGDSTVMQLVYIVNKIYDCLDRGNEVRAVFLNISKAFDKVWHAGLLARMKNLGVGGTLLNWFESYLTSRQQRVVIEGSSSS